MLEDIRNEDTKLKEWLYFSLETLRRDKRRRKDLDLLDYFEKYKKSWQLACNERGVEFVLLLPQIEELKIRVFEAELDCILNNLLINSFEAFLRKDAPPKRVVTVKLELQEGDVHLLYTDSGPGLSKDIVDPEMIFEPHFTTKKDLHTGEDTGTGLGMWLVRSFVGENNGSITLLENYDGFGVSIVFPDKVRCHEET